MTQQKNKNYPILLLIYLFLIMFALSFLTGEVEVFGIRLKVFDPISDIKPDSLVSYEMKFFRAPGNNMGILMPAAFALSDKLEGNSEQMSFFYQALKQSKNQVVRIAHFGDSVIEGDLITADIRSSLQNKFSGEGVGMLSFTPDDIKFRVTLKHNFSDDWKTYTIFAGNHGSMPIGINGTVSVPSAGSWIKLESPGIPGTFKKLKKVFIYYSDAKNSTLKYSLDNGTDKSINLKPGTDLNRLVIDGGNASSIKITATQKEQARFYGISIESESGIIVDNFPLRGNSGVSIREISKESLSDFNKFLDYKLVILQFGLNMITSGQTNYEWYEKEMIKMIGHLKSAFPKTSFLLVSVGDKCMKKGSRLVTDPSVIKLINTQKNIAEKSGIAFWNLFEAMGGENSMRVWADSKPPLAMKDYTHFNNEGAKRIAKMLSEVVLSNYN